jgi:DNA-binding XRE family transcriptional regulator
LRLKLASNGRTMDYMGNQNNEPYAALGARLRFLREQWQQTLQDVSGTLEIDEKTLTAIEAGKTLPPADMLDMLISHFLLTEDQAQDLRELADDQQDIVGDALTSGIDEMLMKQIVMYLPIDSKVLYTDSMQATVNDNGVVLQFMQTMPNGQQAPVSRVGMSRDHAQKVVEVLQNTLNQHTQGKPKYLSDSSSSDK